MHAIRFTLIKIWRKQHVTIARLHPLAYFKYFFMSITYMLKKKMCACILASLNSNFWSCHQKGRPFKLIRWERGKEIEIIAYRDGRSWDDVYRAPPFLALFSLHAIIVIFSLALFLWFVSSISDDYNGFLCKCNWRIITNPHPRPYFRSN